MLMMDDGPESVDAVIRAARESLARQVDEQNRAAIAECGRDLQRQFRRAWLRNVIADACDFGTAVLVIGAIVFVVRAAWVLAGSVFG